MDHATLQSNLIGELYAALRGGDCEVLPSSLRLRVSPGRMYAYPDLSVVRGEPLVADDIEDILLNPTVIFEVVSPSTERYDRGTKFQRYREIQSLQDYILVNQNMAHIEQFTRGEGSTWTLRDHDRLSDQLKIDSIAVTLPLTSIYDGVELPAAG